MLDSSSDFLFLSSAMSWTISALADTFSCPDEPEGANMELENSVGPPMDELPPGIPPKVLLFPSESSTSMFVWLVFHAMVYSLKHHPQTKNTHNHEQRVTEGAKSSVMICFDVPLRTGQAVHFAFVVLCPSFLQVKTKNEAVLMCASKTKFYKQSAVWLAKRIK